MSGRGLPYDIIRMIMNSERKNIKLAAVCKGHLIHFLMACALLFLLQSFAVRDARAQNPVYFQPQQLLDLLTEQKRYNAAQV